MEYRVYFHRVGKFQLEGILSYLCFYFEWSQSFVG
jgi:hypothetical protein